jgi:type II restriction enzyme
LKGYDVFVPASDVGRISWSRPTGFRIRRNMPMEIKELGPLLSEIDVVWIAPASNSIEGVFEVEHTTTIYSALLRFNDVLLTDPKVSRFSVVSEEGRRSLFARQLFRPTFMKSGLSELTSFLEYSNVLSWHSRLLKSNPNVADGNRV